MSSSVYPQLYAGQPNPIFNTADFYVTQYIDSLQTNTSTSSSIISNAIALLNDDGSTSNTATEPWVTTQINNAVSTLSGGTLQSTLSTLQQIDAAINNDPNFYTDITASIATVQTNVNTNSSAITALQNRATTDETNITNLQNTKLNVSNPNYTGTMYGPNLNLTGTFTTSGNINVNGVSVSPAQISYLGNITSDIQNQLNSKASTSSPIFTGTLTSASIVDNGSLTCNNGLTVSSGTVSFPNNSISQNAINGLSTNLTTNNLIVNTGLTSASIVDNGTLTCNNGLTVSSGTVSFPNNSISQNAINNLSSTLSTLAPINNASLTGNPTVPTQTTTDNSTKIASTAYVQNNLANYETTSALTSTLSNYATKSSPSFTGIVTLPSVVDNGSFTANNGLTVSSGTVSFPSGSISQTAINGLATSLSSKQNTLVFDSVPTSGSSNVLTSGAVYTADANLQSQITSNTSNISTNTSSISSINTTLAGKQNTLTFDSSPTSSSTNPVTSGGIYTALATKQNTLTFDSSPTASSTNPVTSGGIYSALQNYETTSALTTTLSNYATNSSLSSYAPINNASLTGITTVNELSELVYNASSGTNLSLTYTSIKGIIYYSPSANFTLTLSSVPTSSTTETYSLTFIYNTKYYCNGISVNGTSYTMIAGGGLSNISINSSATYVMQQINICFLNSSTPIVVTNVLSLF